jgi:hypothetical protein
MAAFSTMAGVTALGKWKPGTEAVHWRYFPDIASDFFTPKKSLILGNNILA